MLSDFGNSFTDVFYLAAVDVQQSDKFRLQIPPYTSITAKHWYSTTNIDMISQA